MKHNYFLVALFATVLLSSCQGQEDIPQVKEENFRPKREALEKISPDIMELSANDASKVAALFTNSFEGSRSAANKSVSNVRTIVDENGVPALYAVNMGDGYIIISASKHTNPIKAIVPHGQFDTMHTDTGQDDIIQDMIAEVKHSRKFSQTDSVKREWHVFEKANSAKEFKSRAMSQEF